MNSTIWEDLTKGYKAGFIHGFDVDLQFNEKQPTSNVTF